MTAACLLTIDQGTTSTRAILFDENARILGIAQKELALHCPHNGWVEQNPEDIWCDVQKVCRDVLKTCGVEARHIAGIGITNQRETTVVWDRATGKPLYNAIVWQDRRTAEFCEKLRSQGHNETVAKKTGLLLDPYFSATKVKWILDHVSGARGKAERGDLAFGTIDCFLLWRLTGGKSHATDATNAARTMLYDITAQQWDKELCGIFGVPATILPEVKDNSCLFGTTTADFLGAPIPIAGMAGDQQSGLFGQACFAPGMVKSTYGTGCFALVNIGDKFRASQNRMLTTTAYRLEGKTSYAIEGSIFTAGAAVQWLRDQLGIITSANETAGLATSVPDNGGVYLVPAFTGLGAPHWDPHARGMITGLTRASTAAHIVRAALEAQGYQTQDLMAAMAADADCDLREIRVDGGMVRNDWICQFIADITQKSILRPAVTEATALGAVYLAGLHVGVFSSLEDISRRWQCERTFAPQMKDDGRKTLYAGWQGAVKRALDG